MEHSKITYIFCLKSYLRFIYIKISCLDAKRILLVLKLQTISFCTIMVFSELSVTKDDTNAKKWTKNAESAFFNIGLNGRRNWIYISSKSYFRFECRFLNLCKSTRYWDEKKSQTISFCAIILVFEIINKLDFSPIHLYISCIDPKLAWHCEKIRFLQIQRCII